MANRPRPSRLRRSALALGVVSMLTVFLSSSSAVETADRFGDTTFAPVDGSIQTDPVITPAVEVVYDRNGEQPTGTTSPGGQLPDDGRFIETVALSVETAEGAPAMPAACRDSLPPTEPPFTADPPGADEFDQHRVPVALEPHDFICNGRYTVAATVTLSESLASDVDEVELFSTFSVAVAPRNLADAPNLALTDAREVKLQWVHPYDLDDRPPDFLGFRIERALPGEDFVKLGDLTAVDRTTYADKPPSDAGTYRYRVRPLRSGPDGPVPSRLDDADALEASVDVPTRPTTTSTTFVAGTGTPPTIGTQITLPTLPSRTVTTNPNPIPILDTGFEDEIDYGDAPLLGADETDASAEAFSGGATILREDDGFTPNGLVKPAAGAMVLAGWAIHLRRLSRLAAVAA